MVGEHHVRLRLTPEPGAAVVDAIAFDGVARGWAAPGERVRLVYRLVVDRYRSEERVQLVVTHLEDAQAS